MAHYGFLVLEVHVAIGLRTGPSGPTPGLLQAMERNERFAHEVADHPRGHVLPGRLQEFDGVLRERQVDVCCAVEVARQAHRIAARTSPARAIVVLSKDVDIIPAYRYADEEVGVPVYAAASTVVPGMRVLVRRIGNGFRFIGALEAPPLLHGARQTTEVRVVRLTGTTSGGLAVAVDAVGHELLVRLPAGEPTRPGTRYAAVLIDRPRSEHLPRLIAHAVSSALP